MSELRSVIREVVGEHIAQNPGAQTGELVELVVQAIADGDLREALRTALPRTVDEVMRTDFGRGMRASFKGQERRPRSPAPSYKAQSISSWWEELLATPQKTEHGWRLFEDFSRMDVDFRLKSIADHRAEVEASERRMQWIADQMDALGVDRVGDLPAPPPDDDGPKSEQAEQL